jgi:hypothetical protein
LNNLKLLFVLLSGLLLSGCATTYKDFKTSDIKPNEAVAIGKVNIKYNGKSMNNECFVCLNSSNGPCQKLTEEGFVFQNIPKGVASLSRIACKDTSQQHYNITGANFKVADDVNYFGEVNIDWTNKGGFKTSDLFGAVGMLISEANNDGTIKMNIKEGNMNDVVKAYEQQTKLEKIKANKCLIKSI